MPWALPLTTGVTLTGSCARHTVNVTLASRVDGCPGGTTTTPAAVAGWQYGGTGNDGLVAHTEVLAKPRGSMRTIAGAGATRWIDTGPMRPPAESTNQALG